MTNFDMVEEFMSTFGQEVLMDPTLPGSDIEILRLGLILEEVQELFDAHEDRSLIDIADALTDILYVVYGAGHAFGIDLDASFEHVHASNMSKLGEDGKPIYREDGKVMKGPDYWPPDLGAVIY